jgi:integrase/recombinase XerD
MASLYKKPIKVTDPKTGEKTKAKSKKWWGRYRDESGKETRVPLATDKTAAQAMLNELVRRVERKMAGLEDPFDKHHKRRLNEHLEDFKNNLSNKGSTPDYVNTTWQRVQFILEECKFERINQVSASRVLECLAELRAVGKSVASSNHYLRATKMFTRWLVRDRRTNDDRLAHLSKMNSDLDRRRVRRPLSMDEFALLLESAEVGPSIQHVSGADRAILYIVGAYTGYRRNEIGSVTIQSFDFDSEPPTLTVAAGHSKHRRTDVLPLRRDFANRIRKWLSDKPDVQPDEPLLQISNKRTAEMIRKDMAAARAKWIKAAERDAERERRAKSSFLAYCDDRGHVVDFHALRKTFITNLTRSGATPKTAQMLARHSDINLTMNSYTMIGVMDQVAAVEALPPIPAQTTQQSEQLRATGTDPRVELSHARHRRREVPTVVPRGAENGAKRTASNQLRIAPNCTDEANIIDDSARPIYAKSSEDSGAVRASVQQAALSCTQVPEVGLEPTLPCGNWILSPARLPFRHSGCGVRRIDARRKRNPSIRPPKAKGNGGCGLLGPRQVASNKACDVCNQLFCPSAFICPGLCPSVFLAL